MSIPWCASTTKALISAQPAADGDQVIVRRVVPIGPSRVLRTQAHALLNQKTGKLPADPCASLALAVSPFGACAAGGSGMGSSSVRAMLKTRPKPNPVIRYVAWVSCSPAGC
jgi:hypothetical protein